jgi:protein-S-isoprenylcysteine O-methyltransferase Ste14
MLSSAGALVPAIKMCSPCAIAGSCTSFNRLTFCWPHVSPVALVLTMENDHVYRTFLLVGWVVLLPFAAYYRLKSQSTREPLDRRQEGLFILATLRPTGIACLIGVVTYLVSPARMTWSSVPLPVWLRAAGIGLWFVACALLVWTLRSLGPNLTDTVVTRKAHTLVTTGPYRWVRHPFYDSVYLMLVATALVAANWFILLTATVVFGLLAMRTAAEERHLLARFGERYRAYQAATGRFVPRLHAQRERAPADVR